MSKFEVSCCTCLNSFLDVYDSPKTSLLPSAGPIRFTTLERIGTRRAMLWRRVYR